MATFLWNYVGSLIMPVLWEECSPSAKEGKKEKGQVTDHQGRGNTSTRLDEKSTSRSSSQETSSSSQEPSNTSDGSGKFSSNIFKTTLGENVRDEEEELPPKMQGSSFFWLDRQEHRERMAAYEARKAERKMQKASASSRIPKAGTNSKREHHSTSHKPSGSEEIPDNSPDSNPTTIFGAGQRSFLSYRSTTSKAPQENASSHVPEGVDATSWDIFQKAMDERGPRAGGSSDFFGSLNGAEGSPGYCEGSASTSGKTRCDVDAHVMKAPGSEDRTLDRFNFFFSSSCATDAPNAGSAANSFAPKIVRNVATSDHAQRSQQGEASESYGAPSLLERANKNFNSSGGPAPVAPSPPDTPIPPIVVVPPKPGPHSRTQVDGATLAMLAGRSPDSFGYGALTPLTQSQGGKEIRIRKTVIAIGARGLCDALPGGMFRFRRSRCYTRHLGDSQ